MLDDLSFKGIICVFSIFADFMGIVMRKARIVGETII
jgi:hypothetical protein